VNPGELVGQLQSSDVDARREAARQAAVAASELNGYAVPLVQAVADPDEQVCESVVAAIEEMGAPDAGAVAELAGLLSHQNADVGYWAATLLGRCGASAGQCVPALTASLSPPAAQIVQQRSAWALGKIGPAAAAAVPALEKAAQSGDARLARLAQKSLGQIGG
jgi:HEAT repeat protein